MCFPNRKTVLPFLEKKETYINIVEPSLLLNQAYTPFVIKGKKFNTMTHYYYYHLIKNHSKIKPEIELLSEIFDTDTSNMHLLLGDTYFDSINPYKHLLKFRYRKTINILITGLFEKFKQNSDALLELLSNDSYIYVHMDDLFLGCDNSGYNVLGIVLMYIRSMFMEKGVDSSKSIILIQKLLDVFGELEEALNEPN